MNAESTIDTLRGVVEITKAEAITGLALPRGNGVDLVDFKIPYREKPCCNFDKEALAMKVPESCAYGYAHFYFIKLNFENYT